MKRWDTEFLCLLLIILRMNFISAADVNFGNNVCILYTILNGLQNHIGIPCPYLLPVICKMLFAYTGYKAVDTNLCTLKVTSFLKTLSNMILIFVLSYVKSKRKHRCKKCGICTCLKINTHTSRKNRLVHLGISW